MTNQQHPAQFDWATELLDAEGRVTLSAQEAKEIGVRLRSMGEKLKAYEDLDEAASDVQLLRMGYAAARLEIESLQARIKTMAEEHADELMVAHLDGRMRAEQAIPGVQWQCGPQANGFTAPQADSQPAPVPDMTVMQLAESVGLIGPASRTHDLHAAIQRFHDLICANATIKAAAMAAEAISVVSAHQWDVGYPPLPKPNIQRGGFPNLFTEDQMSAYVDADRTARAPADSVTAPAGGANWQDISTAPKDGTRFVAVGNNYGLYSETQHTCIAQWFRGCWMEASDWNETSELKYLTHWMPLLPLPGSAEMRTQQTIEQQEIALLTDEELCQIEEPHLVNFRIPLGGQYDFARDVEKAVLEKTRGMQAPTPPAQAADSVLEDAAQRTNHAD